MVTGSGTSEVLMRAALEALGTAAYGALSALVPVVNPEAYALVAATRSGGTLALVVVVALAAGQTAGKLVLFEAARRGAGRWSAQLRARATRHGASRAARWGARITSGLARRRTRVPLLLASSALGLPPLAAVSLAAGTSRQPRWEFAILCLIGRIARFGVLVLPAAYAVS